MLSKFTSEEAVRVATDGIYVRKEALSKLQEVEAFEGKKKCNCGDMHMCLPSPVAPAQWRNKGEKLFMPQKHASYLPKAGYERQEKEFPPPNTAPSHDDLLSRHALSYLNGGGESGKKQERLNCTSSETPWSSPRHTV